jgi:cytidylate kinase
MSIDQGSIDEGSIDVLAIDGPAGAGKSTVAKRCAAALGLAMLDTGAMYRAVTLACLRRAVALDDAAACTAVAEQIAIDQHGERTYCDGSDVSLAIRAPDVTAAVSVVSAHPGVRARMVLHQRRWAQNGGGGVVEGRDIGTVVFPDARLKVFLVASPAERAERRHHDEAAAGREVDIDTLVAEIEARDRLDRDRAVSPMVPAGDAVLLDTTGRTIDDVVAEIIARYRTSVDDARTRVVREPDGERGRVE